MKTTIDLPEGLYRDAKIRAVKRGVSLRGLIIKALQSELESEAPAHRKGRTPSRKRFQADETGWPVLHRKEGRKPAVTNAFVNQLREEEGV